MSELKSSTRRKSNFTSRRILKIFAIFVATIMLFTTMNIVAEKVMAELIFEDSIAVIKENVQIDDNIGNIDELIDSLKDNNINKNLPKPGTVNSVLSPIEPIVSDIGEFYIDPILMESSNSYYYNVSFGKYAFSKETPYQMKLTSYYQEKDNMSQLVITESSEFFVRSTHNISYGYFNIIEASNENFIVQRELIIGREFIGYLETNVSFSNNEKPPKITAKLHLSSHQINDTGISWKILLGEDLNLLDDSSVIIEPQKGIIDSDKRKLILNKENCSINKIGEIDWTDANAGIASLLIENTSLEKVKKSIVIDFPKNMFLIDPVIVGTASYIYALPGTPCRNAFFTDDYYWMFWYTGSAIAYKSSNDGIDWSSAVNTLPTLPGTFPLGKNWYDVAMYEDKVLVAIITNEEIVYALEGAIGGSTITWDAGGWDSVYSNVKFFNAEMTKGTGSYIKCLISIVYNSGYDYVAVTYKNWGATGGYYLSPASTFPYAVGSLISIVGMTTVRLSSQAIRLLVSYEYSQAIDEIGWEDYYPNLGSYGIWTPYNDAEMVYVPRELSAVTMNNGDTVYAAGRRDDVSGRKVHIWKFKGDGNWEESPAMDTGNDFDSWPSSDGYGRCTLSKVQNNGLILFYLTEYDDPNDLFNLYYRYKLAPTADWSEEIFLWDMSIPGESGDYLDVKWVSAGEIVGDMAFVNWWGTRGNNNQDIIFLSLPTLSRILATSPDEWARPGLNPDQPLDIYAGACIAPGNGQLFASYVDLTAGGRLIDLSIGRTYSTPRFFTQMPSGSYEPYMWQQTPISNLGDGWQLDMPWIDVQNGFVHWWSRQQYLIEWEGDKFENKLVEIFTLVKSGSNFFLYTANGQKYSFDSNGRWTGMRTDYDWNGANPTRIMLYYNGPNGMLDKITDSVGRDAIFSYDVNNRLSSISYVGQTITYQYDGSGRLQEVIDDVSRTTTYAYRSDFPDFPLLESITVPEGGINEFSWSTMTIGTQAISKMCTLRYVWGSSIEDWWISYDYEILDGNVKFTRLEYDDYDDNTEGLIVDYVMDSNLKSLIVVLRDENENELRRTREWYSSTGRIAKTDNYASGVDIIEHTTYEFQDNLGNAIYSYEKGGSGFEHETFSSYSNSEFTNIFYKPGKLDRYHSGNELYEDFSDYDLSDANSVWTIASSGGAVSFDNSKWGTSIPSLKIAKTQIPGESSAKHYFASQTERVVVSAEVRVDTDDQMAYFCLRGGNYINVYFAFHYGQFGYYDGSDYIDLEAYEINKWYKITFDVYDIANGLYKIYIDDRSYDAVFNSAGNDYIDNVYFQAAWVGGGSGIALWIDDVIVYKEPRIVINDLKEGMRVELLDTEGAVVAREIANVNGHAELVPSLPTDAYPFGTIVIRNVSDTIEMISEGYAFSGDDWFNYEPETRHMSSIPQTYYNHLLDDGSKWPYVKLWDDSFDGTRVNWDWVDGTEDPAGAISGEKYHKGIGEPGGINTHWVEWSSVTPAATTDDFIIQFIKLPADNYPFQVLIGADVDTYSGIITRKLSWGASIETADYDMGPLPPPDQWHALIFKTSLLGINTMKLTLTGPLLKLSFTVVLGSAMWDYTRWVDGGSGDRWPYIKLNNLVDVNKVELYDNDKTLLSSDSTISGGCAELWCGQTWPYTDAGVFPIEGFFVIEYSDGIKKRTDTRTIFAGDEFDYQETEFYSNELILDPSTLTSDQIKQSDCYGHLSLGSFESKGSNTETDDMYSFIQYGQSGQANSRLTQTKTKHSNSWYLTDYTYNGPYYQLTETMGPYDPQHQNPSEDPCRLVTEYVYDQNNWAYVVATRTHHDSGDINKISQNSWDIDKDLLLNSRNPRGYWTVFEYDSIGRPTKIIESNEVFRDDFGDSDLSDWTIDDSGGFVGIDETDGYWSSPCLKLERETQSGVSYAHHEISLNPDIFIVQARMKVDDTSAPYKYPGYLVLKDASNPNIYFAFRENHFQYYDGVGGDNGWHNLNTDTTYVANQWYEISLKIDIKTDTFNVFIDGELKHQNAAFYIATEELTQIYFQAGGSSGWQGNLILWVDDILVQTHELFVQEDFCEGEIGEEWYQWAGEGASVGIDDIEGCVQEPSVKMVSTIKWDPVISRSAGISQIFNRQSGHMLAEAKLKMDTDQGTLSGKWGAFWLIDTTEGQYGTAKVYISLVYNKIRAWDAAIAGYKDLMTIDAGTWYHILADVDLSAGTYDVYIDGESQPEWQGLMLYGDSPHQIDKVVIKTWKGDVAGDSILWADDILIQTPESSAIEYHYGIDESGCHFIKTKDENNHWIQTYVDGFGRVFHTHRLDEQHDSYSAIYYSLNRISQPTEIALYYGTVPNIVYEWKYYDALGRIIKEENNDNTYKTASYDDKNHRVTLTDEEGRQKIVTYDIAGRLTSATRGSSNENIGSYYAYDEIGNIVSAIQGGYFFDDFSIRNSGHNWEFDNSGGFAGIDEDDGNPSSPCIRLTRTDGTTISKATHKISVNSDHFTAEAYLKAIKEDSSLGIAYFLLRGDGGTAILFAMYYGKFRYYDGYWHDMDVNPGEQIISGNWYRIRFDVDMSSTPNKYDIYIDSGSGYVKRKTGANFYYDCNEITQVFFQASANLCQYDITLKVDDVRIHSGNYQTVNHDYDDLGRLIKTTYATNDYEEYTYDAVGRLIVKGMRNGIYEYLDYDSFGYLESMTYGNSLEGPAVPSLGSTEFTYDENGNVLTATRANLDNYIVDLTYTYDARDRVITEQYDFDRNSYTTSYEYDKKGNLIAIDYPYHEQFVTYERDWYDRIVTVYAQHRSYTVPFAQFEYDGLGRITSIDYYSGATTTYTYDSMTERLNSVETILDQETILLLDYTYDDSGRITDVTDEHYVYDSVGRLTYANGPWGTRDYTYDSLGNRIQMNVDSGSEIVTYSYDNADDVNQLTSIDSTSDELDRDYYYIGGCVDWVDYNVGDDWIFTYESDGLLSEIQIGEDTSGPYCYDAFSRKVIYDNWYYVYMGDALLFDQLSGECKIYADGMLLGNTYGSKKWSYYAHCDHLGSVRVVTKWSGQVIFSGRYEPFGRLWADDGYTSLKYLGKIQEDDYSGLYCLGIRFYDPEIGRFIQEDPILGDLSSPLTLNRYVYCANDPINFADYDGLFWAEIGDWLEENLQAVVVAIVVIAVTACTFGFGAPLAIAAGILIGGATNMVLECGVTGDWSAENMLASFTSGAIMGGTTALAMATLGGSMPLTAGLSFGTAFGISLGIGAAGGISSYIGGQSIRKFIPGGDPGEITWQGMLLSGLVGACSAISLGTLSRYVNVPSIANLADDFAMQVPWKEVLSPIGAGALAGVISSFWKFIGEYGQIKLNEMQSMSVSYYIE